MMCSACCSSWRWQDSGVIVVLVAQAAVVFINPQIVNTSTVYTGAGMVAAATLLVAHLRPATQTWRSAVPLGLVYAALVTLKSSFALFVAVHLICIGVYWTIAGQRMRATIRGMIAIACCTSILIAPWIIVHLPLYMSWHRAGS